MASTSPAGYFFGATPDGLTVQPIVEVCDSVSDWAVGATDAHVAGATALAPIPAKCVGGKAAQFGGVALANGELVTRRHWEPLRLSPGLAFSPMSVIRRGFGRVGSS